MSNREVSPRITSLGDNFYKPTDLFLSQRCLASGNGTGQRHSLGLGFGDGAQT